MNNKINEKVSIKEFTDNRKNNTLSNNVIAYVNEIIKAGLAEHASDIHIKFDLLEGIEIKYRIDGYLAEKIIGKKYYRNYCKNKNFIRNECCREKKAARW